MRTPHRTLNCRGRLLTLDQPVVMGILNVTPDSFYDGGRFLSESGVSSRAEAMLEEGAAVIDIGGMSSRPGAENVSQREELRRVIPAVAAVSRQFPDAIISVDTVRAAVARAAVEEGAHLINDISAGSFDENMYPVAAELKTPYILMHMQGKPATMQKKPRYDNIAEDILDFFIRETGRLRACGVKDIVLDPGFGFGKTVEHNYQLLRSMHVFAVLGLPLLAGISRKSMIYRLLDISPEQALNATSALHMVALQQGASILRAHDVREAVEVIKCWKQLEIS